MHDLWKLESSLCKRSSFQAKLRCLAQFFSLSQQSHTLLTLVHIIHCAYTPPYTNKHTLTHFPSSYLFFCLLFVWFSITERGSVAVILWLITPAPRLNCVTSIPGPMKPVAWTSRHRRPSHAAREGAADKWR